MHSKWPLIAMVAAVLAVDTAAAEPGDTITQYPGWELIWNDEFEQDGRPDPANWDFERGFVRNRELQWYQPENAFCENGMLIIEGRRERKPNPNYEPGSRHWGGRRQFIEYTASSLRTRGKHSWQCGRFEIRAKIDARDGFNPFRQPHYLLLNLAIGGTNGGDPSDTTFPTRYKIDYVRVYQKK